MRVGSAGSVHIPDYPSATPRAKDAARTPQETLACTPQLSYEARLFLLAGKKSAEALRRRAAKLERLQSRVAAGTYSIDRDRICDLLLDDTNEGEARCLQSTTTRR